MSTPKPPLSRLSAKRRAKRLATEGRPAFSTIAPTPKRFKVLPKDIGQKIRDARRKKPRKASETLRAHGPPEYRAWMKTQPCIVPGCKRQPCDSAHVKCGGKGRKDDWTRTVPLCTGAGRDFSHHEQYDNAKKSFVAIHGLDMLAEADANHARWQSHLSGRE